MTIKYRLARTDADYEAAFQLLHRTIEDPTAGPSKTSARKQIAEIESQMILAFDKTKVIGAVFITRPYEEVQDLITHGFTDHARLMLTHVFMVEYLGVAQTHRRQGVATTLIKYALAKARQRQGRLVLTVVERNIPARHFFEQNGFHLLTPGVQLPAPAPYPGAEECGLGIAETHGWGYIAL